MLCVRCSSGESSSVVFSSSLSVKNSHSFWVVIFFFVNITTFDDDEFSGVCLLRVFLKNTVVVLIRRNRFRVMRRKI